MNFSLVKTLELFFSFPLYQILNLERFYWKLYFLVFAEHINMFLCLNWFKLKMGNFRWIRSHKYCELNMACIHEHESSYWLLFKLFAEQGLNRKIFFLKLINGAFNMFWIINYLEAELICASCYVPWQEFMMRVLLHSRWSFFFHLQFVSIKNHYFSSRAFSVIYCLLLSLLSMFCLFSRYLNL